MDIGKSRFNAGQFQNLAELDENQIDQYQSAIAKAFPEVISKSRVIEKYWHALERYYPEYQQFLLSPTGELMGFMNAIPFAFAKPLDDLPEEGWDWMLAKGIADVEAGTAANYLGGLQVIVREKYQSRGLSKKIIAHCLDAVKSPELTNMVIPIRPTKKHLYPHMSMREYVAMSDEQKLFDPWIRTHIKGGAQIIKICERSMTIRGDVQFWEQLFGKRIAESGDHILEGALSPIKIDLDHDVGEYLEPNIWIKYD